MPSPLTKRIGYQGAVEQPIRYSWSSRTGFQTIRTWIGPQNSCIGLMPQLQTGGWDFEMSSPNGANYTMVATIGYSWSGSGILDNPVDVWEITSTKVEKELLQSNNSSVASCTTLDIKILTGYIADPTGSNYVDSTGSLKPIGTWTGLNDASVATPLTSSGQTVASMLVAGVRSATTFQPTLRHTQTVSGVYAIATAITNVGVIHSTALVKSYVPVGIQAAIIADPSSVFPGAAYGWQKDYPNVTVSAFNKAQITQDFVFGAYLTSLFGAVLQPAS